MSKITNNKGFIKLPRDLYDHPVWTRPRAWRVFIWCLLRANYKERIINWPTSNGITSVNVYPGQLVTGRLKGAMETGLTESAFYREQRKLVKFGLLTLITNNQYTLVTICDWNRYSGKTDASEQRTNSGRTADEHKQEGKEGKEGNTHTWRDDFKIYLKECKEFYSELYNNKEFISTQERLNPKVNVKLTMEKSYNNFWGAEAGWKHKKKSKSTELDWKSTITNSISQPQNRVYFTKEELENQ